MSVGWYNNLKDLAAVFGCPDDEGRARFIDFGTKMAAWLIFACTTLLILFCIVQADLYYIIFGYVTVILYLLLLLTLEDWRYFLATKKSLKQRVQDWFLHYLTSFWTPFRSMFTRSSKNIRKVILESQVTNGREKTPSPSQSPIPPAPQPSGIEFMRNGVREITDYDKEQSDLARPAVAQSQSGTDTTVSRRPRTRSVTRLEQLRNQQVMSGGQTPMSMSTTTQQQQPPRSTTRRGVMRRRSRSRSTRGR